MVVADRERSGGSDVPRRATPQSASRATTEPDRPRGPSIATPHRERPFEPGAPAGELSTPAERAAYERGVAYELARRQSLSRMYEALYGEEIGALMRLPLPNAWRALESLAEGGDDLAAEALFALSSCAAENPRRGETYRRMRDTAVQGLARADAAFVHGALDTELLGIDADARTCAAAGLDRQRLIELASRRLRARGDETPMPVGENALAWLDYYRRAFPSAEQALFPEPITAETTVWLDRLDAAMTPEEWAAFRRDAPDDPALAIRVAYCALARCADLPPQAWTEADVYIDRAAQYGFAQAISHVIDRHEGERALVDAHAWAEFGMWVIASGCFPVAQSIEYAQLARQRALLAARLTPAQFVEARRHLASLTQAHGNAALAAQGCGP